MTTSVASLVGFSGWVLLSIGLLAAHPAAHPAAPGSPSARPGRAAAAPKKPASKPLTAAAAQDFWRHHNLAPLWQLQARQGGRPQPGFFGKEGFKMEFALLRVQRVAGQPHVYRVEGKTRCLRNIAVPFSGSIVLRQVYRVPVAAGQPPVHTVVGSFEFEEARIARNTGVFRGTIAADVTVEDGQLITAWAEGSPAASCGYRFSGQWRSPAGDAEPVVWAERWRTLAQQLFDDFEVGDRTPSINRKYADRGWSNYWENDEWWADSPGAGPGLSL